MYTFLAVGRTQGMSQVRKMHILVRFDRYWNFKMVGILKAYRSQENKPRQ
jgi:hypothetical protein